MFIFKNDKFWKKKKTLFRKNKSRNVKEVQKIVVNTSDEVVALGRLDVEPGEEVRVATPKAKAEVDDLLKEGK